MANRQPNTLLRQVRQFVGEHDPKELCDFHLLDRFARQREGSAFEILLQRYGPMVWRVCQRILGDRHAVEDAVQATFLVLVRKAASIKKQESLAGWLYRVAFRIAVRTRADAGKVRASTTPVPASRRSEPDPANEVGRREVCTILDEEMVRLPERWRAPVLLCYVEGLTRDQAAQQLGWSLRTLQRRLEQGRELLRRRLTRRGVTLAAAMLAAELCAPGTHAGGSAQVIINILQTATRFLDGTSDISPRAASLALDNLSKVASGLAPCFPQKSLGHTSAYFRN